MSETDSREESNVYESWPGKKGKSDEVGQRVVIWGFRSYTPWRPITTLFYDSVNVSLLMFHLMCRLLCRDGYKRLGLWDKRGRYVRCRRTIHEAVTGLREDSAENEGHRLQDRLHWGRPKVPKTGVRNWHLTKFDVSDRVPSSKVWIRSVYYGSPMKTGKISLLALFLNPLIHLPL